MRRDKVNEKEGMKGRGMIKEGRKEKEGRERREKESWTEDARGRV